MRKFILLSASMLMLSNIAPMVPIYAQTENMEVVTVTLEQTSELQTELEDAVAIYHEQYPETNITNIDIHLHQETSQFIVRIIGEDVQNDYQLIRYNNENFLASQPSDDNGDNDDLPIVIADLASLDLITQAAMESAQSDKLVNWHLDNDDTDDDDDDDDRLEWELTFIENDREIVIEVDALTGRVVDRDVDDLDDDLDERNQPYDDRDDDDDDRYYYRQFYSNYSGSRPTVYDDDFYERYYDDNDWDDDDWDDDDWDDDDWDDDDWDDDDWDDDDWDDDWDDDDWDDDDWDDDDWDDDDWDDDDWDDDNWDD